MAQSDDAVQADERRVDWGRLADGVFLAGLGVFACLNAAGRLPWTFWFDVLTLWPVVLVTGGLRIAFAQTRRAWLILCGPLVVLALFAAMATGRIQSTPGDWRPVSEARAAGTKAVRIAGGLASSRIALVAKDLADGVAVEGRRGSRDDKARIEHTQDGSTDEVRLVNGNYGLASAMPGRTSRWELAVTDAAPVALRLEGAMVGAEVDLSRGQVEDSSLKGVFLGASLRLPRPQAPVKLQVAGVFNVVELIVPAGTPVRVHGPGLPANAIDRGTGGDPQDAATPGYEVRVEGIFSRLAVTEG